MAEAAQVNEPQTKQVNWLELAGQVQLQANQIAWLINQNTSVQARCTRLESDHINYMRKTESEIASLKGINAEYKRHIQTLTGLVKSIQENGTRPVTLADGYSGEAQAEPAVQGAVQQPTVQGAVQQPTVQGTV